MAKKMAKKIKLNSKTINLAVNAIIIVLALVAILLAFAPSIVWGDKAYSGWDVTFGYTSSSSIGIGGIFETTLKGEVFLFSFANLLTYILAFIAIVGAVLAIFSKCRWILVSVAAVSIVSGVFFLLTKNFACLSEAFLKAYELINSSFVADESVVLGGGAIASSVMMFVAGALALGKAALSFIKK